MRREKETFFFWQGLNKPHLEYFLVARMNVIWGKKFMYTYIRDKSYFLPQKCKVLRNLGGLKEKL